METIDEEITKSTIEFMEKASKDGKPFFIWWNTTRMHIWTHLKPSSQGVTGLGIYPDGLVEHDGQVGELLRKLDELGIADNTIVMYSTDNGAESMSWPNGGATIFRGEKNTNWEGGYRVPCFIRWPGVIKPGTIINDIGSHEDMFPTPLAAAGDTTAKEDLLKRAIVAESRAIAARNKRERPGNTQQHERAGADSALKLIPEPCEPWKAAEKIGLALTSRPW